MTTRRRLLALALAAMMLAAMALGSGFLSPADRTILSSRSSGNGYEQYENDTVKFTMDVPAGYNVTEPYPNGVMIADGDDFVVAAEYAFTTADNTQFIQSADDFAAFIEADESVLADWAGTSDLEIVDSGWGEVEGKRCYVCAYTTQRKGESYSGALYLFDGKGDFGCYCLQVLLRDAASNAETYVEQLEHMLGSFTVTGAYQQDGYTLYNEQCEDLPVQFFARDTAEVNAYSSSISIYPVDGVFVEANISVRQCAWESTYDLETVMDSCGGYYFKYRDDARLTAQPSHFDLGRYSYDMLSLECYRDGEHYAVNVVLFVSGDYYWEVSSEATDEYVDQVTAALSDTLFSLRVNNDGASGASAGGMTTIPGGVDAVLDATEKLEGFNDGDSGWMEPLGFVAELDDGMLLLTEYETVIGNNYSVMTDAWLIRDGGATLLARNELYKEVGGNSGSVSLLRRNGTVVMMLEFHMWEGDQFNNYYAYFPLDEGMGAFGEGLAMEAHGQVGAEKDGQYIVAGTEVSQSAFEDAQDSFSLWIGPMNIQQGPGNGDVMDFSALRRFYPD